MQDEEAALRASSEGKEGEDGAGHRPRLRPTVHQGQPSGTGRRGDELGPRGRLRGAFEGTISLKIRDDNGTVIAEDSTEGGSNRVMCEFNANLEFDSRPNWRLGMVEAFEESASASGEDLHLDRLPIVFG